MERPGGSATGGGAAGVAFDGRGWINNSPDFIGRRPSPNVARPARLVWRGSHSTYVTIVAPYRVPTTYRRLVSSRNLIGKTIIERDIILYYFIY